MRSPESRVPGCPQVAAAATPARRGAPPFALALLASALLSGCAFWRSGGTPDNEPTLATLAGRQVAVQADRGVGARSEDEAIAAWSRFLAATPRVKGLPERSLAMRRLGDLEMARTDSRIARGEGGTTAEGAPDYRAAAQRYRERLAAFPADPDNDRVLYQLARAEEQGGALETALATLDRLVEAYPTTAYRDEAQFRRGELLFAARDYAKAEAAYSSVIDGGPAGAGASGARADADAEGAAAEEAFRSRALYMQGWSRFKQGRLDEALQSFFGVFDLSLAGLDPRALDAIGDPEAAAGTAASAPAPAASDAARPDEAAAAPGLAGLTRAERELVEDTLRVASISLANLQGAESIPRFVTNDERRGYEVQVYRALGELYLKQERVKDAADAYAAFVQRQPLHPQAPRMLARTIDIVQGNGFATLALEAKQDFVTRYGAASAFRRAEPAAWAQARPLLRSHLAELARHYHAASQQALRPVVPAAAASAPASATATAAAKAPATSPATNAAPSAEALARSATLAEEAVQWYRRYLESFPGEPGTAAQHYLLADLLREQGRYAEAAVDYEQTAYDEPAHVRSADAGYAALLAHAALATQATARGDASAGTAAQRAGAASALRFAERFPADPRLAAVLANAAETLFALGDGSAAAAAARRVVELQPPAAEPQRRIAWTVLAHGAFDRGDFAAAERDYGEVLALVPASDAARAGLAERRAAAVYKQGEQAREAGQTRDAVAHFERLATVAPESPIRAAAQFDAAAALIGLKDWAGAAALLEDFRRRFPGHALQAELGPKLALARIEQRQWAQAADEVERIAAAKAAAGDSALARDAQWQAAELREKAVAQGAPRRAAMAAWERYATTYPQPLEPVLEARQRLVVLAQAEGEPARVATLRQQIVQADLAGGSARTARTRTLASQAALALAAPAAAAYREVQLVEPLAAQLKLKKSRMEQALAAYATAADFGIAEATTEATYETAALYQDFGAALVGSERPRGLAKDALAQYEVLLEEQAFPFEEKATELHELNARRAGVGLYDAWVRKSYAALATLRPVRYGKAERLEEEIDAIR